MNRPSLLSGGTPGQPRGSSPNRILADMEGRTVSAPAPRRESKPRPPRSRKGWLALAIIPALLLAGLGWWWLGSPSASPQKSSDDSPTMAATNPAASNQSNSAVIVDDRSPEQTDAPHIDAPPVSASISSPAITSPAIPTAVNGSPEPTTPAVPPAVVSPSSPASTHTPRSVARNQPKVGSSKTSDQDLIGTLMGIIKQKETTKGSKPESMDGLIAQIQADQSRTAAANQAAIDSIDPANSAHSETQVKLRRCPPANTMKGIECRRKICAKMAGKDAACPAS